MPETLTGIVERVVFHNPETGFAVLRVLARAPRGQVTVVGTTPAVYAGEQLTADGEWVQDPERGIQFKAASLAFVPPHAPSAVVRYLSSGLVKGIGGHFAQKIVDTFGERTLQVIDESPSFLNEVHGIGPKRIEIIRESWRRQKAVREIMMFLQSLGVGHNRANRIYKTYGDNAIQTIKNNPYCLATDIWGIGFKTADEMAEKLGIERQSPHRARAAILYVLKELSGEGHVGFPELGVLEQTHRLTEINIEVLREAVRAEIEANEIIRDPLPEDPWLYLSYLHRAEVGVTANLMQLKAGAHPLPRLDVGLALKWVGERMKVSLAPAQEDAIRRSCREKMLVITGGPGVGKTTIVKGIIDIFSAKKMNVVLCAPTGRAAKRLSETTGRAAKTIHRLLEYSPAGGFQHDEERPIDADLVVVDETSMVDITLMNHLLRAISPWACVLLVGDVDQLPSVGPGSVLKDIIESKAVPVVRLTHIFRQAGASWIVRAAHAVNSGEMPESAPAGEGDFYIVDADSPAAIIDKLVAMIRDRVPAKFGVDAFNGIQILTPMNRGELGVRNLNTLLQQVLNPPGPAEVQRYGLTFRVGDKVMQTENNYQREVFNGDLGRVTQIHADDRELIATFDGKPVSYDFEELDELTLAYACTIHKSQGSEYPVVLIPLHSQHFVMLQRNLLYTAITRGKKLVAVVGPRKALSMAVRQADTSRRFSMLAERLRQADRE